MNAATAIALMVLMVLSGTAIIIGLLVIASSRDPGLDRYPDPDPVGSHYDTTCRDQQ